MGSGISGPRASRPEAGRDCGDMELTTLDEPLHAIRCDHDGLKMAEVKDGHLILRDKHHGETHVKVVALALLLEGEGAVQEVVVRDVPA